MIKANQININSYYKAAVVKISVMSISLSVCLDVRSSFSLIHSSIRVKFVYEGDHVKAMIT